MSGQAAIDTEAGAPSPGFRPDQLDGFRIAVTSDRRSEDLIAAFARRGADVLHAPTIRMAGVEDDGHLEAETRAIVAARPNLLLATTSYGVRRWFETADAAGIGHELLDVLSGADIYVRGPKARGAVRAAGLDDRGMGERETTESLVDLAISRGVAGAVVAVQLHGVTDKSQLDRLRAAGATVLTARPYVWHRHDDQGRVRRLVSALVTGGIDAVTFTSAPAADALLQTAAELGLLDQVIGCFHAAAGSRRAVAAAVGPVTAEPLLENGIEPVVPQRFRMGALVKLVCDQLEEHRVLRADTAAGPVSLRGRVVELGGVRAGLSPTSLALFRRLFDAAGATVSRPELAAAANEPLDEHGVDVSMSRLRQTLPNPQLVQTVIKRGYRLSV